MAGTKRNNKAFNSLVKPTQIIIMETIVTKPNQSE
jgi:hypothetical protein